ncbi:SEC-C motif-containing protein [Malonomonas rubra DSM 5091]|uniref:SEC-C motif-containing protein n=1 Tax=Malonomonas rubra DSM 5091 TaxID=1122189 RepID=A0A1M6CAE9_MALRU|nr:hypothetical protein [Malonomonas rubra]SHI57781.1 SEC-C motif-containing protein [Malonomonas rubra DSM 5091]
MTADVLLERRFAALADGDFATVYATYHQESPFIQQFSSRGEYVRFAKANLSAIQVKNWQVLSCRELDDRQQEHLLVIELSVDGYSQFFYELALLVDTEGGWRYHSAQKLGAEDYSGPPDQIDFEHFDRVTEKIRY